MPIFLVLNFSSIERRSEALKSLEYACKVTAVPEVASAEAHREVLKKSNSRTRRDVDSADLVNTNAFVTL